MTELEKKEFKRNISNMSYTELQDQISNIVTAIDDGCQADDTFLEYAYYCYETHLRDYKNVLLEKSIPIDDILNAPDSEFRDYEWTDTHQRFLNDHMGCTNNDCSIFDDYDIWCEKESEKGSIKDICEYIDKYPNRFGDWFYVQMVDGDENDSFTLYQLLRWFKMDDLLNILDCDNTLIKIIIYNWIWSEISSYITEESVNEIDRYFEKMSIYRDTYYDVEKNIREILDRDEYILIKDIYNEFHK